MSRLAAVLLLALACVLAACGAPKQPPPPPKIHTTYRVIAGVSMGGMGTASLAFTHPDRFDAAGMLGGPLDAALLLRTLDQFDEGSFCPLATLVQAAAQDPNSLNDPKVMGPCMKRPTPITWEHSQDFNHWVYTSNGGSFDRSSWCELFGDLTLAYGNLLTENPSSPYAPPGIDPAILSNPPADYCTNPRRVKGLKNREYNPDGKYDAITFCDGQQTLWHCNDAAKTPVDFCADVSNIKNPLPQAAEGAYAQTFCASLGGAVTADKKSDPLYTLNHAGVWDPCRQPTRPLTVALAYDINGNGRRDYGEPLVYNAMERFDDVGSDGCSDAFEDGHGGCGTTPNAGAVDPNHDNYDVENNPLGTENDWVWEQGEPYRDDGLDGIPGTGDVGENNGQFDMTSGRKALFAQDARTNFKALDAAGKARLSVLGDGGIRDMANFGLMSKLVLKAVQAFRGDAPVGIYRDFTEIPGMVDRTSGLFSPWNHAWAKVPRDVLMNYGKDNPTDDDRVAGDGDHVGTNSQAASRFYTLFNWTASLWPNLARPPTPLGGSSADQRQKQTWYSSTILGAKRAYGVMLPPGYDDPQNADARYPVLYLLHGYGQGPYDLMATALITDAYVTDQDVQLRPMIIVTVDGRCCFHNSATGARDCRETNDSGTKYTDIPGWVRECSSGSFYVNSKGYTGPDATRYGDSFFELMDEIDQNYRTLPPADVEAR